MADTLNFLLSLLKVLWGFVGHFSDISFVVGIILTIFYARSPSFKQWVNNNIKPLLHRFFRVGVKSRREQILSVAIIRIRGNPHYSPSFLMNYGGNVIGMRKRTKNITGTV